MAATVRFSKSSFFITLHQKQINLFNLSFIQCITKYTTSSLSQSKILLWHFLKKRKNSNRVDINHGSLLIFSNSMKYLVSYLGYFSFSFEKKSYIKRNIELWIFYLSHSLQNTGKNFITDNCDWGELLHTYNSSFPSLGYRS